MVEAQGAFIQAILTIIQARHPLTQTCNHTWVEKKGKKITFLPLLKRIFTKGEVYV
jgi:hypothetical protein